MWYFWFIKFTLHFKTNASILNQEHQYNFSSPFFILYLMLLLFKFTLCFNTHTSVYIQGHIQPFLPCFSPTPRFNYSPRPPRVPRSGWPRRSADHGLWLQIPRSGALLRRQPVVYEGRSSSLRYIYLWSNHRSTGVYWTLQNNWRWKVWGYTCYIYIYWYLLIFRKVIFQKSKFCIKSPLKLINHL